MDRYTTAHPYLTGSLGGTTDERPQTGQLVSSLSRDYGYEGYSDGEPVPEVYSEHHGSVPQPFYQQWRYEEGQGWETDQGSTDRWSVSKGYNDTVENLDVEPSLVFEYGHGQLTKDVSKVDRQDRGEAKQSTVPSFKWTSGETFRGEIYPPGRNMDKSNQQSFMENLQSGLHSLNEGSGKTAPVFTHNSDKLHYSVTSYSNKNSKPYIPKDSQHGNYLPPPSMLSSRGTHTTSGGCEKVPPSLASKAFLGTSTQTTDSTKTSLYNSNIRSTERRAVSKTVPSVLDLKVSETESRKEMFSKLDRSEKFPQQYHHHQHQEQKLGHHIPRQQSAAISNSQTRDMAPTSTAVSCNTSVQHDVRIEEESDDEDDEPYVQSQLFVGDLCKTATEADVRSLLGNRQAQVWIGLNMASGEKCGFVKLGSLKEAKQVLKELSGRANVRLTAALDFENFKVGPQKGKQMDTPAKKSLRESFFQGYVQMECPDAPLLGVRYITEYIDDGVKPRVFVCSLCLEQLNGPEIANHVVGFSHRVRFFKACQPAVFEDLCLFGKSVDFATLKDKCEHYAAQFTRKDQDVRVVFTDTPQSDADVDMYQLRKQYKLRKKLTGAESPEFLLNLETNTEEEFPILDDNVEAQQPASSGTRDSSVLPHEAPQTFDAYQHVAQLNVTQYNMDELLSATQPVAHFTQMQQKCVMRVPYIPKPLQDAFSHYGLSRAGHLVTEKEGMGWVHFHNSMRVQNNHQSIFIGLCEIVEVQHYSPDVKKTGVPDVAFKCLLCNQVFNQIQLATSHSVSFNHRYNYLQKCYPSYYEMVKAHTVPVARKRELNCQSQTVSMLRSEKDCSVRVVILQAEGGQIPITAPPVKSQSHSNKDENLLAQLHQKLEEQRQITMQKLSQMKQPQIAATPTTAMAITPTTTMTIQPSLVKAEQDPHPPAVSKRPSGGTSSKSSSTVRLKDLLTTREPIIGLRFVTELLDVDNSRPAIYECGLCKISKVDANKMFSHVTGTVHRIKFLESNFPVLSMKCRGRPELLTDLSQEVEEKYGRDSYCIKKLITVDTVTGKPVYSEVSPAKFTLKKESPSDINTTNNSSQETGKLSCFENIIAGLDYTPLLGLKYITELLLVDEDWTFSSPTYKCSLCPAAIDLTTDNILKHICSITHRTNFIKQNYSSLHQDLQIYQQNPGKYMPLLNSYSKEIEMLEGRGTIIKVVTMKSDTQEMSDVNNEVAHIKSEPVYVTDSPDKPIPAEPSRTKAVEKPSETTQSLSTSATTVPTSCPAHHSIKASNGPVQVYLGNWPQDATLEELQDLLKPLPHKDCHIKVSQSHNIKYGSVDCENYTDARELMTRLNKLVFKGRSLRLRIDQNLYRQQSATDIKPGSGDQARLDEGVGQRDLTEGGNASHILEELDDKEAEALREAEWKYEIALLQERSKVGDVVNCTTLRQSKLLKTHGRHLERFYAIGLSWVTEVQKSEDHLEPWFLCYLCHHCILWNDIKSHLTSLQHRLNYLKKKYKVKYDSLLSVIQSGCEDVEIAARNIARGVARIEAFPTRINIRVETVVAGSSAKPDDDEASDMPSEDAPVVPSSPTRAILASIHTDNPLITVTDIVTETEKLKQQWEAEHEDLVKKMAEGEIVQTSRRPLFGDISSQAVSEKNCVFVGLTWLTELQTDTKPKNIRYLCRLCRESLSQLCVLPHLLSLRHRLLYMKKCHTSVFEELEEGWASRVRLAERVELWAHGVIKNEPVDINVIEVLLERPKSHLTETDNSRQPGRSLDTERRGLERDGRAFSGVDRRDRRGQERDTRRDRVYNRSRSRSVDRKKGRSSEKAFSRHHEKGARNVKDFVSHRARERSSHLSTDRNRSSRASDKKAERRNNDHDSKRSQEIAQLDKVNETQSERAKSPRGSKGTDRRRLSSDKKVTEISGKSYHGPSSRDTKGDKLITTADVGRNASGSIKSVADRDNTSFPRPEIKGEPSATLIKLDIDAEVYPDQDVLSDSDIYVLEQLLYQQQDELDQNQDRSDNNPKSKPIPSLQSAKNHISIPTDTKSATDNKSKPTNTKPAMDNKSQPTNTKPATDNKSQPTNTKPATDNKSQPTNTKPAVDKKSQPTDTKPAVNDKAKPTVTKFAMDNKLKQPYTKPPMDNKAKPNVTKPATDNKSRSSKRMSNSCSNKFKSPVVVDVCLPDYKAASDNVCTISVTAETNDDGESQNESSKTRKKLKLDNAIDLNVKEERMKKEDEDKAIDFNVKEERMKKEDDSHRNEDNIRLKQEKENQSCSSDAIYHKHENVDIEMTGKNNLPKLCVVLERIDSGQSRKRPSVLNPSISSPAKVTTETVLSTAKTATKASDDDLGNVSITMDVKTNKEEECSQPKKFKRAIKDENSQESVSLTVAVRRNEDHNDDNKLKMSNKSKLEEIPQTSVNLVDNSANKEGGACINAKKVVKLEEKYHKSADLTMDVKVNEENKKPTAAMKVEISQASVSCTMDIETKTESDFRKPSKSERVGKVESPHGRVSCTMDIETKTESDCKKPKKSEIVELVESPFGSVNMSMDVDVVSEIGAVPSGGKNEVGDVSDVDDEEGYEFDMEGFVVLDDLSDEED